MPAFPAGHSRIINHLPRAALYYLAFHNIQKYFSDGQEEYRDKQGNHLCQDDKREGKTELLFAEGIADVYDINDY